MSLKATMVAIPFSAFTRPRRWGHGVEANHHNVLKIDSNELCLPEYLVLTAEFEIQLEPHCK